MKEGLDPVVNKIWQIKLNIVTEKSGMPDTVKCLRKIKRINNNIFVSA